MERCSLGKAHVSACAGSAGEKVRAVGSHLAHPEEGPTASLEGLLNRPSNMRLAIA